MRALTCAAAGAQLAVGADVAGCVLLAAEEAADPAAAAVIRQPEGGVRLSLEQGGGGAFVFARHSTVWQIVVSGRVASASRLGLIYVTSQEPAFLSRRPR